MFVSLGSYIHEPVQCKEDVVTPGFCTVRVTTIFASTGMEYVFLQVVTPPDFLWRCLVVYCCIRSISNGFLGLTRHKRLIIFSKLT